MGESARHWPALDARTLFALWRLSGCQDRRAEANWIAFEEGWTAGEQAACCSDLQEPSPLLCECKELLAQWCGGVIESWVLRLEAEAESRGCECDGSTNYMCCNHRECPCHRQEARANLATWLEARTGEAVALARIMLEPDVGQSQGAAQSR
jgi:hypothetical protein